MSAKLGVSFVIIPFSISSIILLSSFISPRYTEEQLLIGSAYASITGFIYLVLVILYMKIDDDEKSSK